MVERASVRNTFRLGLALAVLLGVLVAEGIAGAQDDEDTIIDLHNVEVIFPTNIRFYIKIAAQREDLASVSLTAQQGDHTLHQGEIDIDENLFVADFFYEIRYHWRIPPGNAPTLFEPITYRWVVIDRHGARYEAEGDFVFEDARQTWRRGGEPPLRLSTCDENLGLGLAREAIRPAYDLLRAHTGLEPDFNWLILPRGYTVCEEIEDEAGNVESITLAPLSRERYPCSEANAERIYAGQDYRPLYRGAPGLLGFQNELISDMTAVFYDDYWRGFDVPAWFRAGLASFYGVAPDPFALQQMRSATRADSLFDADDLNAMPDDSQMRTAWAGQAHTMTLYLADAYGADAPFDLARAVPAVGFEAAFSDLSDGDMDDFLIAWERWLFTAEAERAVAWTVYLPITATLPPTDTHTPFPPTRTPTPLPTNTGTPTPTPTATSRVIQVPSPLPTFTATQNVTATPSNTPRPPGSLDQPEADSGNGGGGLCPSGVAALSLPALALVFAVGRRNRRP